MAVIIIREARQLILLMMTVTVAKITQTRTASVNICVRINYSRNDGYNDDDIVTHMQGQATFWEWKAFL